MKPVLNVVKIGGNVLDDEQALEAFLQDFAALSGAKILVHGGGKIATQIGEKMGLKPHYINGRRVTDAATLELVTMVYGGLINRRLVAALQRLGCTALGLSGADANLMPARKRPVGEVDFGWVGDPLPERVNVALVKTLVSQGVALVMSPLTHDEAGNLLNTNADTISATLAQALTPDFEVRLLFCFEKKGVLSNPGDDNSVIPSLSSAEYSALKAKSAASGGILPKLDNAFQAASKGVSRVVIGSAQDLHRNLSERAIPGTEIIV